MNWEYPKLIASGQHQVTPDNVILTYLKAAEEDGIIIRLWECTGLDTTALVDVSGFGSLQAAKLTDLLERDEKNLTITDDRVIIILMRKYSLATIRILFE